MVDSYNFTIYLPSRLTKYGGRETFFRNGKKQIFWNPDYEIGMDFLNQENPDWIRKLGMFNVDCSQENDVSKITYHFNITGNCWGMKKTDKVDHCEHIQSSHMLGDGTVYRHCPERHKINIVLWNGAVTVYLHLSVIYCKINTVQWSCKFRVYYTVL